ncbi:hypothetical protein QTP88_029052 [Uroleucon formosanum]
MAIPSQLKIDNWGNFFMQRLNNLAKRDEYCDYTIRSVTNESFKVHRLVLNTCSDYFISHPSTDKMMTMPVHLDFDAVKSVIMFMYTGQLHYTEDNRMSLIEVAEMLQITMLIKLLESQNKANKIIPKYNPSQASTSRTHSEIALNQYRPAKRKLTTKTNKTVRSLPKYIPASTFINTMKVKDILSENKPMRFECDADDVPEFIEQTFELPKYDSAPLIKQDDYCGSTKAMLKRGSNGELINKSMDKGHRTQVIKCEIQTISSPAGKILKIVNDTDPENTDSNVVQEVLNKYDHLLQIKGNIKLKIISSPNQGQFESIIINTPNSVEKILPAGSGIKKPIITHKVKPDIMNIIGPWSCNLCGTNTNPLKLDSYFIYRRHMVEKHNEKEDTRVCEHCGHFFIRKRLKIHHMYTKHKIQPPADIKFPQCEDCEFIATTKVHLKRHKSLEKCGIKPPTKPKYGNYTCSKCDGMFRSSLMLKGHLRNFHKVDDIIPSTSSTKELLISVIDNIPPGAKVLAVNNIINETYNLGKSEEVIYNEETTEVETVTLEDADQVLEENDDDCKSTVPVDITEEWDDFDDVDTNKNEEFDKDNRDAKPCIIELE